MGQEILSEDVQLEIVAAAGIQVDVKPQAFRNQSRQLFINIEQSRAEKCWPLTVEENVTAKIKTVVKLCANPQSTYANMDDARPEKIITPVNGLRSQYSPNST